MFLRSMKKNNFSIHLHIENKIKPISEYGRKLRGDLSINRDTKTFQILKMK